VAGRVVLPRNVNWRKDYDPVDFLEMVRLDLEQAEDPPAAVIVIALSADGAVTVHTSSADLDRNVTLAGLAQRFVLDKAHAAMASVNGFEEDPEPAA
jgi:hypothetical protein